MFTHYVITRFNVGLYNVDNKIIDKDQYVLDRLFIFHNVFIPSIVTQTNNNFILYILLDINTPDYLLCHFYAYMFKHSFIHVLLCGTFDQDNTWEIAYKECIELILRTTSTEYVITTRIDNDDAFSTDAIETIQSKFAQQELEFVNLDNGYIWYTNDKKVKGFYSTEQLSNPFISLIEKKNSDLKTVYCGNHRKLNEVGKIIHVTDKSYFIQTVHSSNILNDLPKSAQLSSTILPPRFNVNVDAMYGKN